MAFACLTRLTLLVPLTISPLYEVSCSEPIVPLLLIELISWVQRDVSEFNLPQLRKLEIRHPQINPLTIPFLGSFFTSLTTLSLRDCCLRHDDVIILISSFARREGGGLEALRFAVDYLGPRLVDLLARDLPGLEKLDLTFQCLQHPYWTQVRLEYQTFP
jgi:hypothetical protein